jgi:hypothetical protein
MKKFALACLVTSSATLIVLGFHWPIAIQQTALAKSDGDTADGSLKQGLIGHWKLRGDCRDYSGQNNHGTNHGVDLVNGTFDGIGAYIEVPHSKSLNLGTNDFSVGAWVYTEKDLDDVIGDVIDMYDPTLRRGITLAINSSAGGYQGQGNDRHVYFGIDNAKMTEWEDCGRPSPTSNYVSNSLSVYKGKLYAAITDAEDKKDWCHVFRYEGNQQWADCGRVGEGKTPGVGPLIVHNDQLYAVTWTYDWTRVETGDYDPGRVYRYVGGTAWEDCGQPHAANRTLPCAVSYKGKLYVGGGWNEYGIFVQDEANGWKPSKIFPIRQPPLGCFPHAMSRYNGKIYAGFPSVYSFDGEKWSYAGLPISHPNGSLQTHALAVYQGRLHAGTWPDGIVSVYQGGEKWQDIGRVGKDGTEVMDLLVYNGKLYGCSIPRAEICRYDGAPAWTSLKRFYSPEGWVPGPPTASTRKQGNEWSRVTSMTICEGKLYAGTGSCTSSVLDAPCDVRGKVFCMEAGKCASHDDDLGPGWKLIAAVRDGGLLKIYVDGKLVAKSSSFDPAEYDVSTDRPLRIGFGQTDYFAGKISDVRVYNRALREAEIQKMSATTPE